MKIVVIQFPDGVDVTSLTLDAAVSVAQVSGGTIVALALVSNPVAPSPVLVDHTHVIPVTQGVVNIPPSIATVSTPQITTGPAKIS
jgi:hypothetical protein